MLGFDHHRNTSGAGDFLNGFGDLAGQVFLDLQPAGEHVDDPRDLRQAQYAPGGDVCHMGLADEGQHVVLAQRVQLDVLDDDHLVIVRGEQRAVDDLFQAAVVTAAQVLHRLCRALRRIAQTFALRVFTHPGQYFAVMTRQIVHDGSFRKAGAVVDAQRVLDAIKLYEHSLLYR